MPVGYTVGDLNFNRVNPMGRVNPFREEDDYERQGKKKKEDKKDKDKNKDHEGQQQKEPDQFSPEEKLVNPEQAKPGYTMDWVGLHKIKHHVQDILEENGKQASQDRKIDEDLSA